MLRYGFGALVLACITGCGFAHDTHPDKGPSPLEDAAGKYRILVICTGEDTGPQGVSMYGEQLEEAKTDWPGYLERDLIVVWLRDSALSSWTPFRTQTGDVEVRQLAETDDPANLRGRTNCKPGSRGLHLIGKDTGLKKSWTLFASNTQIFLVIDAMPIRQSEMRRAGD